MTKSVIFIMYVTRWNALQKIQSAYQRTVCLSSFKADNDFYLSICIERHPLITCKANNLEQKICTIFKKVEHENSNKSNYDLQRIIESKRFNLLKRRNFEFHYDFIKSTAANIDEIRKDEFKNLNNSSSVVESNENMSYPRRKQEETLFFVTKQTTASNTKEWLLPKDIIYKGETIKQGLKRILSCNCGDNFIAFIYGNSPVGFSTHYSDRYEEQKNICDHNIFYFLARYISGHVRDNTEYQWLNVQELEQILPKSTYTQLSYVFQISQ